MAVGIVAVAIPVDDHKQEHHDQNDKRVHKPTAHRTQWTDLALGQAYGRQWGQSTSFGHALRLELDLRS